jgi:hypothetical protein
MKKIHNNLISSLRFFALMLCLTVSIFGREATNVEKESSKGMFVHLASHFGILGDSILKLTGNMPKLPRNPIVGSGDKTCLPAAIWMERWLRNNGYEAHIIQYFSPGILTGHSICVYRHPKEKNLVFVYDNSLGNTALPPIEINNPNDVVKTWKFMKQGYNEGDINIITSYYDGDFSK